MLIQSEDASYWQSLARSYAVLGSPLRPAREDIQFMEEAIGGWIADHRDQHLHALLLGVTPELAGLRWPEASSLLAIDKSMAMIRAVWPGDVPHRRQALCANWLDLPLPKSSVNMAVGDGSANCLTYPHGYRGLAASVCHVLQPGGLFALRCYVQPEARERPEDVFSEMLCGAIPTFHHFKIRLLMAMQQSPARGVAVKDVYRVWAEQRLDVEALLRRTGWNRESVEMIELYRGKETVHTFPTLAEIRSVFGDTLEEVSVATPAYPTGECCPTLVLKPLQTRTV